MDGRNKSGHDGKTVAGLPRQPIHISPKEDDTAEAAVRTEAGPRLWGRGDDFGFGPH